MIIDKANWQGWDTVGLIGRGSFGSVYEIERKVFDETEKAALKIISIPQNNNEIEELYNDGYDEESIIGAFESHLKSILAEYSIMRKMGDCVNIVKCDDVRYERQENGVGWDIYIRMELLTPLTKALYLVVSEETVIKLAKDICTALDCCKQHNIIHRDIKPQNIFVSAKGDYKLGDFGIAKTAEQTMGGTKIGTYKYMAPEVYNNQPYGVAADLYSLGLVLYWMLNNRRMPFVSADTSKITVGEEELARNRRLSGEKLPEPANGSKELKAIVMKACAYNPKDRYSSAVEMLSDLNMLEKGNIVKTAPITPQKANGVTDEHIKENEVQNVNKNFIDAQNLQREKENSNTVQQQGPCKEDTGLILTGEKNKKKKTLLISVCAIMLAISILIGTIFVVVYYNNDSLYDNVEDQHQEDDCKDTNLFIDDNVEESKTEELETEKETEPATEDKEELTEPITKEKEELTEPVTKEKEEVTLEGVWKGTMKGDIEGVKGTLDVELTIYDDGSFKCVVVDVGVEKDATIEAYEEEIFGGLTEEEIKEVLEESGYDSKEDFLLAYYEDWCVIFEKTYLGDSISGYSFEDEAVEYKLNGNELILFNNGEELVFTRK